MMNLLFDVDDTLYDQLKPFKKAYDKHFSYTDITIEQLFKLSRKFSDKVFLLSESGQMTKEEMHIYRIQKAFDELGYNISSYQAHSFQETYYHYQKQIELIPDMKNTLDYCKKHNIQLGVITNGPSQHQQQKIKQLNLNHWIKQENIFVSSELGIAKPDSRIFVHVEQKLSLDKKHTFYVGDSFNNDILGAKEVGWKAIWSNRRNHIVPSSVIISDYIIDDEHLLLDFIIEQNEKS